MTFMEPLLFSVRTALSNPHRVIGLSLVGYLWFLLDPALQIYLRDRDSIGWTPKFWIVGMFTMTAAMIALTNFFSSRYHGHESTLKEDLASVRGAYWTATFYWVGYTGLVALSALFLILPAFWTATVFSLAVVGAVINREPGRSPFATSRALAAGHFGPLFGLMLLAWSPQLLNIFQDRLAMPMQARSLTVYGVTMLMMPVLVGAQVGAYHKLWDLKTAAGAPPAAAGSRLSGLAAFFASLGTLFVFILAMTGIMMSLRVASRSPRVAEMLSRFTPPERMILGPGIEFTVPEGWRASQKHPHQFTVWNPANKYIRSLTVTSSSPEYFPKHFQGRDMDAAFIKEYVAEMVLRPRTGEPRQELLKDETLQAGGRTWTVLSYQSNDRPPRIWVYWVTVEKGRLISVTAGHPTAVSDTPLLVAEVQAVKTWLDSVTALDQITFWQRSDELEPGIRHGDRLLVKPYGPGEDPQKGDIIVYHVRQNKEERFALRVAGLPNEEIISRDGRKGIPGNGYLLLADNPFTDQYNRPIGPVDRVRVLGYVTEIYAPRKRAGPVNGRPGPSGDPLANVKQR